MRAQVLLAAPTATTFWPGVSRMTEAVSAGPRQAALCCRFSVWRRRPAGVASLDAEKG